MMRCFFFCLNFLIVAHLFTLQGVSPLKVTSIAAPDYIGAHEEVKLTCEYDLEGYPLYYIRWSFNKYEIYRFDPNAMHTKKSYYVPGIDVDEENSNDKSVVLRNFTVASNGVYKCDVALYGFRQKGFQERFVSVYDDPGYDDLTTAEASKNDFTTTEVSDYASSASLLEDTPTSDAPGKSGSCPLHQSTRLAVSSFATAVILMLS